MSQRNYPLALEADWGNWNQSTRLTFLVFKSWFRWIPNLMTGFNSPAQRHLILTVNFTSLIKRKPKQDTTENLLWQENDYSNLNLHFYFESRIFKRKKHKTSHLQSKPLVSMNWHSPSPVYISVNQELESAFSVGFRRQLAFQMQLCGDSSYTHTMPKDHRCNIHLPPASRMSFQFLF